MKNTDNGIKFVSNPIEELKILRGSLDVAIAPQSISEETKPKIALSKIASGGELILEFEKGSSNDFGLSIANNKGENLKIGFDATTNQFYIDRSNAGKKDFSPEFIGKHFAPRFSKSNTIKLHIFLDASSVEVFADDGLTVMTDVFFPNENFNKLTFYANNGQVKLKRGRGYGFKSAWR